MGNCEIMDGIRSCNVKDINNKDVKDVYVKCKLMPERRLQNCNEKSAVSVVLDC